MVLTPVWVEWGVKLALDLFFGSIIALSDFYMTGTSVMKDLMRLFNVPLWYSKKSF